MNRLITAYFFVLFLFSSLYLTSTFNSIGNIMISIMIFMVVPVLLVIKKKNFSVRNIIPLSLVYFYVMFSAISALANSDIKTLISSFVFAFLVISAFIMIPSLEKINVNKTIFNAILWSNVPIILFPILINGFNTSPYKGIFYNSNSLGTVVATLFAVVMSVFIFNLEKFISGYKFKKSHLIFQLIALFFLFFLIVMSGSRTSSITAAAVILIGGFALTLRLIKEKKFFSFIIKGTFFAMISAGIIGLLIKFTPFYQYLYFNILYKFERKAGRGDVLDERGGVWLQTYSEAGLFGNGSDYFRLMGIGAHNTFISILGESGWLVLILFVTLLLYMGVKSLKHSLKSTDDKYKYLPLLLIVSFGLLSMAENMMFKVSMVGTFFSVGAILNLKYNNKPNTVVETNIQENESSKQKKTKIKKRLVW